VIGTFIHKPFFDFLPFIIFPEFLFFILFKKDYNVNFIQLRISIDFSAFRLLFPSYLDFEEFLDFKSAIPHLAKVQTLTPSFSMLSLQNLTSEKSVSKSSHQIKPSFPSHKEDYCSHSPSVT